MCLPPPTSLPSPPFPQVVYLASESFHYSRAERWQQRMKQAATEQFPDTIGKRLKAGLRPKVGNWLCRKTTHMVHGDTSHLPVHSGYVFIMHTQHMLQTHARTHNQIHTLTTSALPPLSVPATGGFLPGVCQRLQGCSRVPCSV